MGGIEVRSTSCRLPGLMGGIDGEVCLQESSMQAGSTGSLLCYFNVSITLLVTIIFLHDT